MLAHHYSEAGLAEQAIGYWLKAGQQAAELSANTEAIGHLTKGLEVLKSVPESRRRDELELELQTALGMPLIATKGYAALGDWCRLRESARALRAPGLQRAATISDPVRSMGLPR